MNSVFKTTAHILCGGIAAVTPCSIVIVIPTIGLILVYCMGRGSMTQGEDTSEMPTQMAHFCTAILLGSIVNLAGMILLSTRSH